MNHQGLVIKGIFLLCAAFLLAVAIGCAPVQTKSTGGQAETTSVSEGEEEMGKTITQEHLQAVLMDFADTFGSKYARATSFLVEQDSTPDRVSAARLRFYWIYSAFSIASDRNPTINLADMVILVTMSRIVWEEYWQPEVFGESAQVVVKTLKELEKAIWTLAAKVLTPEQQKELLALIHEWLKKNPDQHWVGFIRLSNILELVGEDSVFQEETQPGGLLAPVKEATEAVDEIRASAERAMYLASRMQILLSFQAEMVFHDLANQREIRQLLSDITGFRETVERLPAQVSEERKRLMQELESKEGLVRSVLADIRQTMSEGNDLTSLVNETTKSVDTVSTRIDSMLHTPETGRPFDIMDYYNTVLLVSDSAKQANSLLTSMEELLASPNWEKRMPVVLKLADGVESEGEEFVTHAFLLCIALMLIFFLGMFILIRYASRQFIGLRKEQGTA